MTIQDAKTFVKITETVRGAIHRLYTTSGPKDAAHIAQRPMIEASMRRLGMVK